MEQQEPSLHPLFIFIFQPSAQLGKEILCYGGVKWGEARVQYQHIGWKQTKTQLQNWNTSPACFYLHYDIISLSSKGVGLAHPDKYSSLYGEAWVTESCSSQSHPPMSISAPQGTAVQGVTKHCVNKYFPFSLSRIITHYFLMAHLTFQSDFPSNAWLYKTL